MIQIQKLTKSYKSLADKKNKSDSLDSEKKIMILNDLSLEINSGDVIAIVGSSGSGKSTLLGLISGLDQPDSGEILIDQQSLQKLSGNALTQFRASQIAVVFQSFHLINHLTAFENVALPLEILNKPVDKNKIQNLLTQVGLGHRLHHKPTELSGGESQRLALARALIIEPKLLLADEPSGSLDEETGEIVMKLFFKQVRELKTTTILVTHDMNLALQCDKIYKLQSGQLQTYQQQVN